MDIESVVENIAAGLKHIDNSGVAFKQFQPGVGPYGELVAIGYEHDPNSSAGRSITFLSGSSAESPR